MDFHSTHTKQTPVSTPPKPQPSPNATELASLLASLKERKKEREIANRMDTDLYEKLSLILKKERKTFKEWLTESAAREVIIHGDGNPGYTLDQFQDPNFIACPAFFRDRNSWAEYYSHLNNKQYKDIDQQLRMILGVHNSFCGKVKK